MKLFIRFLLSAAVNEISSGAVDPIVILTPPEKLTALKAAYMEAWRNMAGMSDPFAKETKDAKLAVWKLEGEIKAEEAAIEKAAKDAKLAEARNERLKLSANYKSAILANTGKGANDKTAEAEKLAEEALNNELLAKYAASSPAKKAKTEGDTAEGGKSAANTAAIVELFLAGKTHKEIEEAGYKRSTVWHAINNYKKANA